MSTKIGVSFSTSPHSFDAGREMAETAMHKAGTGKADLALVFASAEHDSESLLRGVKSVIGNECIIAGGTSAGVITNDYMGYEGFHAGIMVISAVDINFRTEVAENINNDEYRAGKVMGRKLTFINGFDDPSLLLFFDSMRNPPRPLNIFYQATPILSGIGEELATIPPIAGVGIASGMNMKKTELWDNKKVYRDAILSLVFHGKIKLHTVIMHGCKPASDYHRITKAKGNLILEVDNRPAIEVAAEYLGNSALTDWKKAMFFITLGVNKGELYSPFREEDYVNRMVLGVDEDSGAISLMEGDLKEGDHFQFMRRSIETDMISKSAGQFLDSLNEREPLFAFYISCLGRVKRYFGSEKEESEEIQATVGSRIPLLGMYSGVEIARVKEKVMPLDWTGVLCIFTRE
ncbi:MAG: FIST N-terminal domain-containing protein [Bacteroidales bacterium]|nr:FIST N-terminal domain-containing protein [Bacteroidales bacterium]MDT8373728.1 FIST N-terminal domain-containing protein [Bacteroidales bacterium]